jgi:hypothetical protein
MKVSRNQLLLACFASFLCLLALLPATFDQPVYQPALPADHWLPGAGHPPARADLPPSILRSPESLFWYNYSPGTGLARLPDDTAQAVDKRSAIPGGNVIHLGHGLCHQGIVDARPNNLKQA